MTDLVTPARRVRRLLLGIGLVVVALLALVAGGVFMVSESLGNNVARIPQAFASLEEATRPPETDEQTFLLIGTDSPRWTLVHRRPRPITRS